MAIRPTDLPTLTTEDEAEIKRLEKNIDKALKSRWTGKPVKIEKGLLGRKFAITEAIKRIFIEAGWTVVNAEDEKGNFYFAPKGYRGRILPEADGS